jgi:hypothetical protein
MFVFSLREKRERRVFVVDGGGEGSSVSVEARQACALFGWRVESERSGFELRRALLREVPTRAYAR